jgi:hypothetical protein
MNRLPHRAYWMIGALALAVAVGTAVASTPSTDTTPPPGVPSPAEARSMLIGLAIAPEGSLSGYSREKFPHWSTVSGSCNTREWVLRRDGTEVRTDPDCSAVSGGWSSPYDGATWSDPSDVDIDHVVPLAEAWRSGASGWPQSQRQAFANDLTNPQLITVTDHVNQAKGDKSPDQWKPPLRSYWCTYAVMWTSVKSAWKLTATDAEVAALQEMLATC